LLDPFKRKSPAGGVIFSLGFEVNPLRLSGPRE